MGGKSFRKQTVRDYKFRHGTKVLVRVDFNVPLSDNGEILNTYKIDKSIPTIEYLANKGCRVVLISHLGRPNGKSNAMLSLAPVARYLTEKLEFPFSFADEVIGDKAIEAVAGVEPGSVLLMENLRFWPGEESGDAGFAKTLASYGEVFVMDAFGVAHRNHASLTGINKYLPSVAGLLVEEEMNTFVEVLSKTQKPVLSIVGGAKIADKIKLINKLIDVSDMLAIGGALANTFLLADGLKIGASVADRKEVELAISILDRVKKKQRRQNFVFYIPEDGVVSKKKDGTEPIRVVDWGSQTLSDILAYPQQAPRSSYEVGSEELILDIGPVSASFISALAMNAGTVIWIGPLGYVETRAVHSTVGPFEHGSHRLLMVLDKANAPRNQMAVVGGGDTTAYALSVKGVRLPDHVSTGGSASLEVLAGNKLPAIEALPNR